jgi:hypothetical protein
VLALSALVMSLAAADGHVYRPQRSTTPLQAPIVAPDESLSDDEIGLRRTRFSWTRCCSVQGDHDEEREADGERHAG